MFYLEIVAPDAAALQACRGGQVKGRQGPIFFITAGRRALAGAGCGRFGYVALRI